MRDTVHNETINPETGKYIPAKREYTVWLIARADGNWQIYHCPDCKHPVIQYKGDICAEVPGEVETHAYPFKIQCKNRHCRRKFVFADATEQIL